MKRAKSVMSVKVAGLSDAMFALAKMIIAPNA
jgi:hypothetical protein